MDNKTLTTIVIVVLAIFILGPSFTGNYTRYSSYTAKLDECGSPGESFCDLRSSEHQGSYRICVFDSATGTSKWSDVIACEKGQFCINKQVSYGVNEARCLWRQLPNQF